MGNNRIQGLFIKLYKPIISLTEKLDDKKNYIFVGNHIGKLDPLLLSSFRGDIKFILPEDSFFYRNLNRSIIDLSNSDIDNLRKAFVETIDNRLTCVFPLNSNNEMERNNYLELLLRGKKNIVPFGIKGSYKLDDDIILTIGQSFQADNFSNNLKDKINFEIKKLIK